ncbi:MAG TPA: TolC family outer membrane protein [Alphaproteobacteria bacterium]|jgi:TolC family type I secretion outer membrane protein
MAPLRLRRIRHVLAVAALLASTALVTSASAETIDEALARAYQTNPTLLAARAALRATDEGVPQALSRWRPTIEASGDISRQQSYSNARSPASRYTSPRGADLSIVQPLYDPTADAVTQRAEKDVLAARARLQTTEQQVLLAAMTAYIDVVRDQAVLDLNINNEQRLRRQLDAANDRFRVGEITRTDVAQAEAAVSRATADRIQAEGNLAASRAVYRNAVGETPATLVTPKAPANLPAAQEEAVTLAGDRYPDVLAADYTEQSARENIRAIEGELWPSLDARGTLSADEATTTSDTRTNSAAITAEISIPLYTAGSVASRIRAAKQTAVQRKIQVDEARRDAMEASTRAWESLETARASLRAYDSEIAASQIALEGVEKEALVGSRTVLDVLDAEQELLTAKVNLVGAQHDEIAAAYEVKAAIGSLTARELGLQVPYYDEQQNYKAVRGKWWGNSIDGE